MNSLLSAISGKLSTSVILGTFFPVTVFVFLARVLWVPMLPGGAPHWLKPVAGLDEPWDLVLLTLAVLVLTGLLYNLNIPLIRFYEGYPWEKTWIGRRKAGRYRAELEALLAQSEGYYPLTQELGAERRARRSADPQDPLVPQIKKWIEGVGRPESEARRQVFLNYPKLSSVLPTRLGNAIRGFENYPERQYGMAAITLWPRLVAVIAPGYAEVIDSSKASLDFMLNGATLSGLLSGLLLVTGLVWPLPFQSSGELASWLVRVALLAALAWWLYRQSLDCASDWGNLVRGAFDLYRGDLLKKLGYEQTPGTAEEERELWKEISGRLLEGNPPLGTDFELPPYADRKPPATSFRCTPDRDLTIARGVVPMILGKGRRVVLEVRHPGPFVASVSVTLSDMVPAGYDYRWGSAGADLGTVQVEGLNPYSFHLSEPLAPWESRQVWYEMVPRAAAGFGGDS